MYKEIKPKPEAMSTKQKRKKKKKTILERSLTRLKNVVSLTAGQCLASFCTNSNFVDGLVVLTVKICCRF